MSFYMHHIILKLYMCFLFLSFLQTKSCQPTTYRSCSNPNDSDENKRNQHVAHRHFPIRCGRGWSGAAVHRTRSISRYSEWVGEWLSGVVWGGQGCFLLSLLSLEQQTGSPQTARLFTLHPRRSCDFHMVSPPSLISAKSAGGNGATGRSNKALPG